MKRTILITLLSSFATVALSQGMFGFQAGMGFGTGYTSKKTLAVEGYYLKKLSPRIYVGGSIFFQRYSFLNTIVKDTANLTYGETLSVSQKSSYLFFCPKIDFGFGYHKYIHAALSFGPGLYLGGNQYTTQFQPFWTNTSGSSYGADTISYNTSYNVPKVIYRLGVGISERIPTLRYWSIILSQEFSYIPGYISEGSPKLNTAYISFQVGIMHKYPLVFVEY